MEAQGGGRYSRYSQPPPPRHSLGVIISVPISLRRAMPHGFVAAQYQPPTTISAFHIHRTTSATAPTMATHRPAVLHDKQYSDPNPLPSNVPHVDELGVTSAPLKSASFFIGQHCKEVNGKSCIRQFSCMRLISTEDFMLCKQENRDPAHCLAEGRKVTRCAQEL